MSSLFSSFFVFSTEKYCIAFYFFVIFAVGEGGLIASGCLVGLVFASQIIACWFLLACLSISLSGVCLFVVCFVVCLFISFGLFVYLSVCLLLVLVVWSFASKDNK